MGFTFCSDGKESTCNAGDLCLIPGLGRSPGAGKRLPTPVFWPGEFHGLFSSWGLKESDMPEILSLILTSINMISKPVTTVQNKKKRKRKKKSTDQCLP